MRIVNNSSIQYKAILAITTVTLSFVSIPFIPKLILMLCGLLMLHKSIECELSLGVVMVLLDEVFVLREGVTVSRYLIVILAAYMLFIGIRNKCKINTATLIVLSGTAIAVLSSMINGASVNDIAPFIFASILCVVLTIVVPSQVSFERFNDYFTTSAVSLSFCIYLNLLLEGMIFDNSRRLFLSGRVNPNSLAIALAVIIATLMIQNLQGGKTKSGFFIALTWVIIVANSLLLLLTGSKSSMLALLIVISICLFKKHGINRKYKMRLILMSTIAIAAIFIASSYSDSIRYIINTRLTGNAITHAIFNEQDRLVIWKTALNNVLPRHLIFGVGIGRNAVELNALGVRASGIHNLFITIVVQLGIVGGAVYYYILIRCIKVSLRTWDTSLISNIFILLMFNGIGEDIFGTKLFFVLVGIIIAQRSKMSEVMSGKYE